MISQNPDRLPEHLLDQDEISFVREQDRETIDTMFELLRTEDSETINIITAKINKLFNSDPALKAAAITGSTIVLGAIASKVFSRKIDGLTDDKS